MAHKLWARGLSQEDAEANATGRHAVLNNTPASVKRCYLRRLPFTSFFLRWATQIRALEWVFLGTYEKIVRLAKKLSGFFVPFDLRPKRDGLSYISHPLRCGTSTGRRSKGAERSVCSFEVEGAGYLPT
nr:MAG TPA: hypothetical protein [Caudoviricetes sp.]